MIELTLFTVISTILTFSLRVFAKRQTKGIIYFLKWVITMLFSLQFYTIFLFGTKIHNMPGRVFFFNNEVVEWLQLPNTSIQLLSFVFCLVNVVFCLPKYSNDER